MECLSLLLHNGASGIALFRADGKAPVNVLIQGCVISNNGEDGIDSSASSSDIVANTISENGWALVGGEGHGILLNADEGGVTSVLIKNNHINQNQNDGIMLQEVPEQQWAYDSVAIEDNYLFYNGTGQADDHGYGVHIVGVVSNSSMDRNDAIGNHLGCYNVPSSGIAVGGNCCNGQGGPGPGGTACLQ
jgi:hypothetical protein